MNQNVKLVLTFSFLWWFCRSLWESNQMSTLVFFLESDSNTAVGLASSIEGISQLIFSAPAGYLTDHWRRDHVLRLASVIGLFSLTLLFVSVLLENYIFVCISLGVWGAAYAFNDAPLEAIFADSTPTGGRSRVFALKFSLMMVGRACGGICVAMLFLLRGDKWNVSELRFVVCTGIICTCVPAVLQAFADDNQSLAHESDAFVPSNVEDDENLASPLLFDARDRHHRMNQIVFTLVPPLLASSDLLTALGAGATVKFFGLFFIENYNLSPLQLSLLLALTPMLTSMSCVCAERFAVRFGRICTILVFHLSGACLLYLFAFVKDIEIAIPLFCLRTAVMNSIKPLKVSRSHFLTQIIV